MTIRFGFLMLLQMLSCTAEASAQQADSAQCRAILAQTVSDSLTVTVGLGVRTLDSTRKLGTPLRANLAAAVREVMQLPRPLPLVLYTLDQPRFRNGVIDSGIVVPTIAGEYAAQLWPNGRLSNLRVIGGGRVAAFDDAFLSALRMVSDSSLLPPLPKSGEKAIELRLSVAPIDSTTATSRRDANAWTIFEPLFRVRLPLLGQGKAVTLENNGVAPTYPEVARRAGVEGTVRLRFVVNADGQGDPGSIQVRDATARDFVSAILDVFPSFRFSPMEFRGCPLASLVEMPFEFLLRRDH